MYLGHHTWLIMFSTPPLLAYACRKYNLPEGPCNDCCVHFWCSPCAICQEAQELRKREGWQTWQ
jgi:Cys-rich protein (TIGR01571 family)